MTHIKIAVGSLIKANKIKHKDKTGGTYWPHCRTEQQLQWL